MTWCHACTQPDGHQLREVALLRLRRRFHCLELLSIRIHGLIPFSLCQHLKHRPTLWIVLLSFPALKAVIFNPSRPCIAITRTSIMVSGNRPWNGRYQSVAVLLIHWADWLEGNHKFSEEVSAARLVSGASAG